MAQVTLRSIAPSAFGPAILFGIGEGAVLPIVAISARDLGASVGLAAFVVALIGLGQIAGDLPAGALAARIGERAAMVVAAFAACLGLVVCVLAGSVGVLGIGILVVGLAGAVFGLARQSYLTEVVPLPLRARALSTLGGSHRVGIFIGPLIGAWVTSWSGTDGAYAMFAICAVAAGVLVLVVPDLTPPADRRAGRDAPRATLAEVAKSHRPVLTTLGSCALLLMAVRQARQTLLPLWCQHLGLDVSTTSLLVGLSGAVDMLLFYPAGSVMDRRGRAWVGVPSLIVLGIGHALLPFSHSIGTVAVVAVVLGIGNGMGAGLVMTLGADASPAHGRAAFLSVWRLVSDSGVAGGPLAVSVVAGIVGLGPASLVIAGLGGVAAAMLGRFAPRHPPHREHTEASAVTEGPAVRP